MDKIMNSPRCTESKKNEIVITDSKYEMKISELMNKNEELERELLKSKIIIKKLEESMKAKQEIEYKSKNNTSSYLMLPSEFKNCWEDLGQKYLNDIFIDFFNDPLLTFHLVQELFSICLTVVEENVNNKIKFLLKNFNIPEEKEKNVINSLRNFINEYNSNIFENPEENDEFVKKVKEEYNRRMLSIECVILRQKDYESLIGLNSFSDMILLIKRIFIFTKFHVPELTLNIESNCFNRKIEFKQFKNIECYCLDGFVKEHKECLVILKPPLLKSNYPYQGLKFIVIFCEKNDKLEEKYINIISEKKIKELDKYTNKPKMNRNKPINITNYELEKLTTTFKKDHYNSFEKNFIKKSLKNDLLNMELIKSRSNKKLNLNLNNLVDHQTVCNNHIYSTNRNTNIKDILEGDNSKENKLDFSDSFQQKNLIENSNEKTTSQDKIIPFQKKNYKSSDLFAKQVFRASLPNSKEISINDKQKVSFDNYIETSINKENSENSVPKRLGTDMLNEENHKTNSSISNSFTFNKKKNPPTVKSKNKINEMNIQKSETIRTKDIFYEKITSLNKGKNKKIFDNTFNKLKAENMNEIIINYSSNKKSFSSGKNVIENKEELVTSNINNQQQHIHERNKSSISNDKKNVQINLLCNEFKKNKNCKELKQKLLTKLKDAVKVKPNLGKIFSPTKKVIGKTNNKKAGIKEENWGSKINKLSNINNSNNNPLSDRDKFTCQKKKDNKVEEIYNNIRNNSLNKGMVNSFFNEENRVSYDFKHCKNLCISNIKSPK